MDDYTLSVLGHQTVSTNHEHPASWESLLCRRGQYLIFITHDIACFKCAINITDNFIIDYCNIMLETTTWIQSIVKSIILMYGG